MGNSMVKIDSLPIKILPLLKKTNKAEFVEIDPSEDFKPKDKTMTIIDTVIGIKDVMLINNIDKIELNNVCSLHDFDLGYNLKLMKKFGMIEKVNIIGVPPDINEKEAVSKINKIIKNLE